MSDSVKIAFEKKLVLLPLDELLPLRKLPPNLFETVKYKRIVQSVAEVGVIEPLVVARPSAANGPYLLLDGHVRLAALRERGERETVCLVADDDEAFTYNKRVNRLATVQEHLMIVRAIERGVSEDKLARALNVDIKLIKRRRTLLDGICAEAVELLKDKLVNPQSFDVLRKMKPMRQIEAAELMISVCNYTHAYAQALLAATKQEDLARPDRPKRIAGMTSEQMARLEREMASLSQDFKALEASYGDDVLHLVIASGYLSRLVTSPPIERYLSKYHPELLEGFHSIIATSSLEQPNAAAA